LPRSLIRLIPVFVAGTLLVGACDPGEIQTWLEEEGIIEPDDPARYSWEAPKAFKEAQDEIKDAVRQNDIAEVDRIIKDWPYDKTFRAMKVAALVAADRKHDPETGLLTDEYHQAVTSLTTAIRDASREPLSDKQVNEEVWMTMMAYGYPATVPGGYGSFPDTPAGRRLAENYCRSWNHYHINTGFEVGTPIDIDC